MFYHWDRAVLVLNCRIQTRAAADTLAAVEGDVLKIRIKAAPVDGAANLQLVKFLARQFKVPQDRVTIVSGAGNRNKRIAIDRPGILPAMLDIKEANAQ